MPRPPKPSPLCPTKPKPRSRLKPWPQIRSGKARPAKPRRAFFAELLKPDTPDVEIRAADYADLYATLFARENVRERTAVHPRVAIWGPFEARLQQPDILILGSLNEGTWPEAAEPGAWLNRPMRRDLGLPAPEEEIGAPPTISSP